MNRTAGVIWTAVSAIAFGTLVSFAEVAKAGKVSTETMLFIRFLVAGTVMAGWILLRKRDTLSAITPAKRWALVGMGSILYLIQSFLFFTGLNHAPGALISVLMFLYPAFVAVGSVVFFKEKMSATKVGALVLAMVGAGMAIGPAAGGDPLGIVYGVGTAIAYSAYILVGAKVLKGIDGLAGSAFVFLGCVVSYGILALVTGWTPPETGASWAACVGLGLGSVIAMGGFLVGIKAVGAVNASTISALEPVVTAILGACLWGENLLPIQWLGGIVIVGAVIWLVRSR